MSALETAFRQAGWQPPTERLMARAVDAWAKHPGASDGPSRRSYVATILAGELTWDLMQSTNPAAVTTALEELLRRAAVAIAAQAPKNAAGGNAARVSSGGQDRFDTHLPNAPAASPVSPRPAGGGASGTGHACSDTRSGLARPAPTLTQLADRQQAATRARTATVMRLSKLDTFQINGQPIGNVTPREALQWAGSRERDARFVRLLTANLPPDRPIREFVRDEDAEAAYARAQEEGTSA